MTEKTLDQWAIVEVMGHQKIAGKVSEQTMGGTSFVRVDVPETEGCQSFTKLLGSGAIYSITFTDEETAKAAAEWIKEKPMDEWSARAMLEEQAKAKQLTHDDDLPI